LTSDWFEFIETSELKLTNVRDNALDFEEQKLTQVLMLTRFLIFPGVMISLLGFM
jgi:hypothetical protein